MGYKLLDLNALMAASEKMVLLPLTTAAAGADVHVKVRRLARIEYLGMLPPLPPSVLQAPKDEKPEDAEKALGDRERAWLQTLPQEEREAREAHYQEAIYKAVARAVLEPAMTVDQVKRLGDDVYAIFGTIREFWKTETAAQANGAKQEVAAGV